MEPLNIWSRAEEDIARLMSHFAHTPFVLDGVEFGSIEAFYSWLLVVDYPEKRAKIAPIWGARSKHACPKFRPEFIDYHGRMIRTSSSEHHDLILRADRAKLMAHPEIARAFKATAPRPIVHVLPDKDDSHDVFCDLMHRLRDEWLTGELAV